MRADFFCDLLRFSLSLNDVFVCLSNCFGTGWSADCCRAVLAVHSVVHWDWVDRMDQPSRCKGAQMSWLIWLLNRKCWTAPRNAKHLPFAIGHIRTQEPDPIRTLKSTCGEVHQYWPWRQTGNMRLPIAFCQVSTFV